MLDIRWIRENPEALDRALEARGAPPAAERLIALDAERRAHLQKLQEAQARRNAASKEIGRAKAAGDEATASRLIAEVAELKDFLQGAEDEERRLDKALTDALAEIPNLPADDVPVGPDESANVEVRRWGAPRAFPFAPKEHFDIGEALGLMDFEAAARMSGARFVVLKGALARLERALGAFMLDLQTREHGYSEVSPPILVRDEALFGTGQLPKFEDDLFKTAKPADLEDARPIIAAAVEEFVRHHPQRDQQGKLPDTPEIRSACVAHVHQAVGSWLGQELKLNELDPNEPISAQIPLWLIPTAEVPLTNLVRESILAEDELPKRVTALTPCFRAEAGAAGKDTRGMIRLHQFAKVELVSIVAPEEGPAELERMTGCAEEVLRRLEIPYRVVLLSTGDMGFAAAKTYDIEVWLPGQGAYREISSCSLCTDFQARRMSARYRPKDERQPRFVHTLNGSGLAVGRTLIAVLENCQEADGSVTVPEALRPYMGGVERIS